MLSNSEAVKAFHYNNRGKSQNIFYEGNILYSYGYHFPMAVRTPSGLYVINGDKYSVTTAKHQSYAIDTLQPNIQIPFSGIRAWFDAKKYQGRSTTTPGDIAKRFEDGRFEIIAYGEDRWETVRVKNPKTGEMVDKDIHHLGEVVIKYKRTYLLSGFDTQESWENGYFLTQLVRPVDSVEDAFHSMKPQEVSEYEESTGDIVPRQGEWYFIPQPDIQTRELDKVGRMQAWKHQTAYTTHIATEVRIKDGQHYVRGVIRHRPGQYRQPQHRMLKLGNTWHKPVHNLTRASYEATGLVD